MNKSFDQLMLKKLLGTISPEEEKAFIALLGKDPNARREYQEAMSSWKERERDAPEFTIHKANNKKKKLKENADITNDRPEKRPPNKPKAKVEKRDQVEYERREPIRPNRRESVRIDSEAIHSERKDRIQFENRDPVLSERSDPFYSEKREKFETSRHESKKPKLNRLAERVAIFFVCFSSFLLFLGLKEYPQLHRSRNNIKTLTLKDSSSVTLKPQSAISVSPFYWKKTRTVYLYGDAYFHVRKEEKPFIVNTGSIQLQVDGTSFIVNAAAEDSVEVLVMKGDVTIFPNHDPSKDVTIRQGQKAVLYKNVNSIALTSFDSINALAWKKKILVFDNTRFEDALPTLQDYFKVNIELKNEAIGNCRISRTFIQPNVVEVMDILRRSFNLTMTREPGKFILDGRGCKFR